MVDTNIISAGINTDYAVQTILSNFSEDFIANLIQTSLQYRFRPFALRSPNYPEIFYNQFESIIQNSTGYDSTIIDRREDTFHLIIDTICNYYNLQICNDIPEDQLYPLAYYMYQIFVSEFTERMIDFYTSYIIKNEASLVAAIQPSEKQLNTIYAKKIYNNQNLMLIYDNMSKVIDILAGIDISFAELVLYLSDPQVSTLINTYIVDNGDIFKNYYSIFIRDQVTKTDMMTCIRFKYVSNTAENEAIFDVTKNPFLTVNDMVNAEDK
jgi:hypothetical protein